MSRTAGHGPALAMRAHAANCGDAVGAEAEARAIARAHGIRVVVHPPTVDDLQAFYSADAVLVPLPYLTRNKRIVDASAVLVACPQSPEEEARSGTWSTVLYARQQGKPVYLVLPDGAVRVEGVPDHSIP